MASIQYSPGMRLIIRGEEWLVNRVDLTDRKKNLLRVTGLSPLVRGQEKMFLPDLEKVEAVDPLKTELVDDKSSNFRKSRLYIESLFRQTPPTDERIAIGRDAAIDPVPYQFDPALQALKSPRQRILIADAVGLGKTIECGILLSELIARGRGKRILVLAVKSMLTQFQKELWTRFTIPLVRLDSVGIQRVRNKIPSNHNPFYYYDKAIISIDTLKQESEYRNYIENARWDVIVIDEAHNVAARGNSQRSRLANLLAKQSDSLIMLSATPHDGRKKSFASLMRLLDPTAIPNPEDYTPDDIGGLFIRRFKRDIKDQIHEAFPERIIAKVTAESSAEEEAAFDALAPMTFDRLSTKRSGTMLFKTTLEKALFSSPVACRETIRHRIQSLQREPETPAIRSDIEKLTELDQLLKKITPEKFGKYQRLLKLLTPRVGEFGWSPSQSDDRVVIFTERIETMKFLAENLTKDLNLKSAQVATLCGSMPDIEIMSRVDEFGNETSPIRILICSDVASEGINLHYRSHRLIHFDIPWSLMIFQQRNGRIDRYGQKCQPEIFYLKTDAKNPEIKGDTRILELLIEKDDEVRKNIGDPSIFSHCFDSESEEALTARAIESNLSPEAFDAQQSVPSVDEENDPMAWLMGGYAPVTEPKQESSRKFPTLFSSDYDYAREALYQLQDDLPPKEREKIQLINEDKNETLSFTPTAQMATRFKFLPSEIFQSAKRVTLCAQIEEIKKEFDHCRESEVSWPQKQYLWRQNPILEYLNDHILTSFDRLQAPVLPLGNRLEANDALFLTSAVIPNRKSQPVIYRWYGLQYRDGQFHSEAPIEEWIDRLKLQEKSIPNPMESIDVKPLTLLLPDLIDRTRRLVTDEGKQWQNRYAPQLREQLDKLQALKSQHTAYFNEWFDEMKSLAKQSLRRRDQELREIEASIEEYQRWVEDAMTIEPNPYVRVIAVFKGGY